MKKVVHRGAERGRGEHGWLSTRHSFSFADWYEPTRMGFGALRVLNDDTIAPAQGFPMHAHRDMEIITIVTQGAVAHRDSIGNAGVVPVGDVQVMSAGTGIVHAEFNASATEPLSLFQIWILPKEKGVAPRYAQKTFSKETLLVAPHKMDDALSIGQDAYISKVRIKKDAGLTYDLHAGDNGAYVFVISGSIRAANETLKDRDAVGVSEIAHLEISATEDAEVLVLEVPMRV